MPARSYRLDTGFTTPYLPPLDIRQEVEGPDKTADLLDIMTLPFNMQRAADSFSRNRAAFHAAFELENDILNTYDLATRPMRSPDPQFDVMKKLQADGLWDNFRDNFIGVFNEADYNDTFARIQREERNKQIASQAGPVGLLAMVLAGTVSPTVLLPFMGQSRGAIAIGKAIGWGFAGGLLQEVPLQLAQETRTMEESAFSVAASTVLGGVLGGAVVFADKTLAKIASELDGRIIPGVSRPSVSAASGGAEGVVRDARLRTGALGVEKVVGDQGPVGNFLGSPVVQNLEMSSPLVRYRTAQLSDAGLDVEGVARGGTVENRVKVYEGQLAMSIKKLDEAYANYFFDRANSGFMRQLGANVQSLVARGDKLTKREFAEQIAIAMENGDQHAIPQVAEVAQFARKNLIDPVFEKAAEAKLFKRLEINEEGEVEVKGDLSYLTRDYNIEAIGRRPDRFVSILRQHIEDTLQADFQAALEKVVKKQVKDKQLLTDMKRPFEEIEKLLAGFRNELKQMDEGRLGADAELDDLVANLRSRARDKALTSEQRAAAKEELKQIENSDDPFFQERREKRKELRKRITNLNRAAAMWAKKQDGKLERINRLEELQFNSIDRAVRKGQKFFAKFDNLTDDEFDAQLEELKNQFEELGKQFDRTEERIGDLARGSDYVEPTSVSFPKVDYATNVKKAAAQGFTVKGFHGSVDVITSFDPEATRLKSGVFFTDNPDFASDFAFALRAGGDAMVFANDIPMDGGDAFVEFVSPFLSRGQREEVQIKIEQLTTLHDKLFANKKFKGRKVVERAFNDVVNELDVLAKKITANYDFSANEPVLGKSPNVTPALLRMKKTYEVEMPNGFDWEVETKAVEYARANGYDSIKFTLSGDRLSAGKPITIYSIFDAENIRSPYDNFNTDDGVITAKSGFGDQLAQSEFAQMNIADRMNRVSTQLEAVDSTDREAVRLLLREEYDAMVAHVARLNARRAARAQRLREQAGALDPKIVQERIAELESTIPDRVAGFRERWRERGAEGDIPLAPGMKAQFGPESERLAREIMERIMGTNVRLTGFDVLYEARGPMLARMLDIPAERLRDTDGVSFLERDVEKLWTKYVRTLAPDIEVTRAFGELDVESGRPIAFTEINEEEFNRAKAMGEEMDAAFSAKHPKPTDAQRAKYQEQRDKAMNKLHEEYNLGRKNLMAMLDRIRHTWGVPKDPAGFAARAARTIMNLNVLRFMGGTAVASIPDVSQPIMRYGAGRVFRDAYLPMIRNFRALRATHRELQLSGASLDIILHSRAHQMWDVGDYMVRGSKFEKAIEWGANKMGLLALFDVWTVVMKQIAGATAIAQTLDDIAIIAQGGAVGGATQRLARHGISGDMAMTIWGELQRAGGGEKIDGIWWPNTEAWKNAEAVMAFRAALVGQVNSTIITPGVERPLWSDANLGMRMISQFKSFAFSSTTKTMMAGLQKRDMAVVTGVMVSLALGALSYYIYAMTAGGAVQAKMEAALDDLDGEGWKVFADEAMARSGVFGALGLMQGALSEIPLSAPYVTFAGQRTSRRGGESVVESTLGPSFDMLTTAANVVAGMDDPTQSTVRQASNLLPLQNHFLLRQAFDKIAEATGLPEKRQ